MNKKTGKITVKHVYQAFSAGLLVYPGGVENQIVGGITQILSRLLVEQFRYSQTSVTSSDFVTYPILRFKDAPKVTPIVLQRIDVPTTPRRRRAGHGCRPPPRSPTRSSTRPASGCATAPFTPARVRAALKAASVA